MIGEAINHIRTGVQKNALIVDAENNWFDWNEYEFDSDGICEEYTCAKCGADISKVIKNYY